MLSRKAELSKKAPSVKREGESERGRGKKRIRRERKSIKEIVLVAIETGGEWNACRGNGPKPAKLLEKGCKPGKGPGQEKGGQKEGGQKSGA